MSILNQLASALNRRDEEPNQKLAHKLCTLSETQSVQSEIQELVDNLRSSDKGIGSDCVKVLYEIGTIQPELIENYVEDFVAVLKSKDNRLVWGGMTALGGIAARVPEQVAKHIGFIKKTTTNGSVITQDWGIRVLATVAAAQEVYSEEIFPYLLNFLKSCRPKDLPRHAESVIIAAQSSTEQDALLELLQTRKPQLKPAQQKRVEKLIRQLEK